LKKELASRTFDHTVQELNVKLDGGGEKAEEEAEEGRRRTAEKEEGRGSTPF